MCILDVVIFEVQGDYFLQYSRSQIVGYGILFRCFFYYNRDQFEAQRKLSFVCIEISLVLLVFVVRSFFRGILVFGVFLFLVWLCWFLVWGIFVFVLGCFGFWFGYVGYWFGVFRWQVWSRSIGVGGYKGLDKGVNVFYECFFFQGFLRLFYLWDFYCDFVRVREQGCFQVSQDFQFVVFCEYQCQRLLVLLNGVF